MNNRMRFDNQHVIVTGGARGIGLEIVNQFVQEGAEVTILDNNMAQLSQTVEIYKSKSKEIFGEFVDLTDYNKVIEIIDRIEQRKPIDILINNAGIAFETPFLELSIEEWKKVIEVNLTAMFLVSQTVAQKMVSRSKGVIVNMSSKNGLDGESGYAHYNASKGGVIMLTKTMALELAKYNIRVNAVCPGYIQTPLSKEIDSEEFTQQFVDNYIPMKRTGTVKEVAPIFLFLASEESSFMTGEAIVVDGGQLAGQNEF